MYTLVLRYPDGREERHEVKAPETYVGRLPGNDLVIDSEFASRQHVLFLNDGNQLFLRDLGSSNGTFLNGRRVTGEQLKPGDRVTIGEVAIMIEAPEETAARPDLDLAIAGEDSIAIIEPALDPSETLVLAPDPDYCHAVEIIARVEQSRDLLPQADDIGEARKPTGPTQVECLVLLHRISELVHQSKDAEDFLSAILQMLSANGLADSGIALLFNPRTVKLGTVARLHPRGDASAPIPVSRTIVQETVGRGKTVYTRDATADPRFRSKKSIAMLSLKSVVCIPLLGEGELLGVLYLTRSAPFKKREIDIIGIIGHLAAMSMQRAHLREEVSRMKGLHDALSHFLSREVIESVVADIIEGRRPAIFMEETWATVLFIDICGFTSLSEQVPPRVITDILNSYYELAAAAIFERGGTLNSFIGDGVFAIFGAPISKGEDAQHAVDATLQIIREFDSFMEKYPADQRRRLRAGLNTGTVIAGTVGSERLMDYTVLGDVVNVASRIEGLAGQGEVLVSEATARELKGLVKLEKVGDRSLKGRRQAVGINRVLI